MDLGLFRKKKLAASLIVGLVFIVVIIFLFVNNRYQASSDVSFSLDDTLNSVNPLSVLNSVETKRNLTQKDNTSEPEVDFSLIALSAFDQTAIIKYFDKTEIITIGQSVGNNLLEVIQVMPEKLVLKNPKTNSIYWVFQFDDSRSSHFQEFSSQIEIPKLGSSETITTQIPSILDN